LYPEQRWFRILFSCGVSITCYIMYFYRSFERNVRSVILWSIQSLRRSIGTAIHWTTFRNHSTAIAAEIRSKWIVLSLTIISIVMWIVLFETLMSTMAACMSSKMLIEIKKRTASTVL